MRQYASGKSLPDCVRTLMKRPVKLLAQFERSTAFSDTLPVSARRRSAPRRSARDTVRMRWHSAPAWARGAPRRGTPSHKWLVFPAKSRWTPRRKWPVLPPVRLAARDRAPGSWRPANSREPLRGPRRSHRHSDALELRAARDHRERAAKLPSDVARGDCIHCNQLRAGAGLSGTASVVRRGHRTMDRPRDYLFEVREGPSRRAGQPGA